MNRSSALWIICASAIVLASCRTDVEQESGKAGGSGSPVLTASEEAQTTATQPVPTPMVPISGGSPFIVTDDSGETLAEGQLALVSETELRLYLESAEAKNIIGQATASIILDGQSGDPQPMKQSSRVTYLYARMPQPALPPTTATITIQLDPTHTQSVKVGIPGITRTWTDEQ